MANKGDILFCGTCGESLFRLKNDIERYAKIEKEDFKPIPPMVHVNEYEPIFCVHCGSGVVFSEEYIKLSKKE